MYDSNALILNQNQVYTYLSGQKSFIPYLKPSDAVKVPTQQIIYFIERKLGGQFHNAIKPNITIDSPLKGQITEGVWLKSVRMVGINVRTIQSFWNVVKYALTLPESQSCIHLLPIWEPGVVASLYGMSTWNINPEFFSAELQQALPHLDTVEKQLKVVINILHGLGKTVGMDVIPHTDRYSEQALANPQCFEWLQRIDNKIIRHENNLYEYVQELIFNYQRQLTPQLAATTKEEFFSDTFMERERLLILFGEPNDYAGRLAKRQALIQYLYNNHLETVPATMGPPYRGMDVDDTTPPIIDKQGREWRDYKITKPQKFSRVFGPLTRFKLFENKDNNARWEIDFDKPIVANWEYAAQHYADIQEMYNFDFMRGDMAHVQMRPEGVPTEGGEFYDILGYIKKYVQVKNQVPYFGSFAETFLAPPGVMAYGDEVAHLEMSHSDTTLGDLQSMVVGTPLFLKEFKHYLDILHTRTVAPNFTIMTADKDDPRFDEFYLKGNEARYFIGLFLKEMPSYMGLGFEMRDPHPVPAPNEHYTKLYVFQIDEGDKMTTGAYTWGRNTALFKRLNAIKIYSDKIWRQIQGAETHWVLMPNPQAKKKVIAWVLKGSQDYLFVVNLDIDKNIDLIDLSLPPQLKSDFNTLKFEFSTILKTDNNLIINNLNIKIENLEAGEGRAYLLS